MKAILVEDETQSQVHLANLLAKYCPDVELKGIATHLTEARALLHNVRPELVFLDIELGTQNGFDLLDASAHLPFSIIFTTAHEKYGVRAIKFSALDYLLKPVKADELISAVQKAQRYHSTLGMQQQVSHLLTLLNQKAGQEQSIAIPQTREIRFIQLCDIIQVKAANNYSILYLTDREQLTVSKGIFHFESLLLPTGFSRVHQSHLVNLHYVRSLRRRDNIFELELAEGIVVPVSRLRVEELKERLLKK